jgi:hypothetical protein
MNLQVVPLAPVSSLTCVPTLLMRSFATLSGATEAI